MSGEGSGIRQEIEFEEVYTSKWGDKQRYDS